MFSRSFSYWLSVRNFYINLLLGDSLTERAKAKGCSSYPLGGKGAAALGRRGKCGLSQGNRLWLLNYELNWQQAMARRLHGNYSAARLARLPLLPVPPLCLLPSCASSWALKIIFHVFFHVYSRFFLRLSDSVLMAF